MTTKAAERKTSEPGRAGPPAHQLVYETLRGRVLFGAFAPGQAVTIQGLTEELGAGMTPVREALRRLTAEGALEFQGNRRICVPILAAPALDELHIARRALEPELAFRATALADAKVIARLTDIDNRLDEAILAGDVTGYLTYNYEFHMELYALADAPILFDLVQGLWLRFGPSLRGVLHALAPRTPQDMHKVLLEALHHRDAKAARQAIAQDVTQGMDRLKAGLDAGPEPTA